MDNLKPCPFCGGEALFNELSNEFESVFKIACMGAINSDCAGLGLDSYKDSRKDSIKAWNTRAGEPK